MEEKLEGLQPQVNPAQSGQLNAKSNIMTSGVTHVTLAISSWITRIHGVSNAKINQSKLST